MLRCVWLCLLLTAGASAAAPVASRMQPATTLEWSAFRSFTSADGLPQYDPNLNRMECSTKQGECVADVQCQQTPEEPKKEEKKAP